MSTDFYVPEDERMARRYPAFATDSLVEATERSWQQEFRGTTDVLYTTVQRYMRQITPQPNARCATFTQSSGSGKSRMNDEFAKKVLYIPVNLGPVGGDVYPPTDDQACYWFSEYVDTPQSCAHHVQAFVSSLFATVLERLKQSEEEAGTTGSNVSTTAEDVLERVARLASEFRMKMKDGMQFGRHGKYRVKFYQSVAQRAYNMARHDGAAVDRTGYAMWASARELIDFLDLAVTSRL